VKSLAFSDVFPIKPTFFREKAFASSVYFSVVVAAIMLLTLDRETSTTDQIIFIDLLCSLSLSFVLSLFAP